MRVIKRISELPMMWRVIRKSKDAEAEYDYIITKLVDKDRYLINGYMSTCKFPDSMMKEDAMIISLQGITAAIAYKQNRYHDVAASTVLEVAEAIRELS